jgi:hypothetical protein
VRQSDRQSDGRMFDYYTVYMDIEQGGIEVV